MGMSGKPTRLRLLPPDTTALSHEPTIRDPTPSPAGRPSPSDAPISDLPEDEALMLEVRDGRFDRLGELFERHHEALYRFCLRQTGSSSIAEDLVQDVFTRMLRYRHTFRDDSRFGPWMYRMARNARVDLHRKQRGVLQDVADLPEGHEQLVTPEEATAELLEDERSRLVRQGLLALPEEKRELLLLARFQARGYEEIAELFDCTVGTLKVRIHRATQQLRTEVHRLLEESPS